MLEQDGKTLLARAVETLRSVRELQSSNGRVEVTICGEREALEGADRAIIDRYPACGPLGGIEAALNDLATREDADWALFIPVDMPLLSDGLLGRLLATWTTETINTQHVKACLVEAEGTPQPLVSLIHRSVLGLAREALDSGRYKVVPVLQSAGAAYTSFDQGPSGHNLNDDSSGEPVRRAPPLSDSREQFINVNTEADLIRVATLLKHRGSNKQPEPHAR